MNNVKRNWITTIFGILMLAMGVLKIIQDPASASDPETVALIGGGAGLIAAKDNNKTGIASGGGQ
jgi:hypothetical protein